MILALDPGETVGWATVVGGVTKPVEYNAGECSRWQLWALLKSSKFNAERGELLDLVIYEQFLIPYGVRKFDASPIEVIGVIKQWAQLNVVQLEAQKASQAKWFWNDDKLREVYQYREKKPHANDAMRHLLYHIHFKMGTPQMKGR
jgi:hypothetical protein